MSLANDKRMMVLIVQILEVAQGGGMSEEKAEEIYNELMSCYSELKIEAADAFFNELSKIFTIDVTKH